METKCIVRTVACLLLCLPFCECQINPIYYSAFDEKGKSLLLIQNLVNKLNTLDLNIRSGAVGGCESGFAGPLTRLNPTARIEFSRHFLQAPSVTVSMCGFAGLLLSTSVRLTRVTRTDAIVTLIDGNLANVNEITASWMACPRDTAIAVR